MGLGSQEVAVVSSVLAEVVERFRTVQSQAFHDEASVYAHELPRALRQGINHFRLHEPSALLLVSGYPVADQGIGRTPAHWRPGSSENPAAREEFFLFLCASLLGDPVAWADKHDGRIVTNIVPVRGDEDEQLASSSSTPLTWHTEDAFHPLRADYLGLMCLRNHDQAATTVASVDDVQLPDDVAEILAQPRFVILPDGSRSGAATEDHPIPLLFGSTHTPYLRLDQHYTRPAAADDAEAASALGVAMSAVSDALTGHALGAGDVLFVDNYRAVHGRESFKARYDGTDRWLKRVNVVRDLRRSRAVRGVAHSRTIG
ncbi:guanitoxin biosynthesis L-enduracididine beta-hydroxylase GntD [Streptomyces sp. ME19-01-6]|uniref:guanitoxin biosynthesis L-enduracididine beta-hydroxylase GntD n=1 Tax=Streptomyces sp. ME19-01-6 TaxID=3028686 RepID=UPI0029B73E1A|nr:guanitoxin biosynthesis L-enduracididine beta-hydroxylase GntD [Streptomyces sp. ME19-01-6]MDX3227396.1 guanitoxin biosynthesis L-enduracididine beta-hydroxylase GntD [Streptomyces sp. ME19-01-6]